jgi:hypothetical protein
VLPFGLRDWLVVSVRWRWPLSLFTPAFRHGYFYVPFEPRRPTLSTPVDNSVRK